MTPKGAERLLEQPLEGLIGRIDVVVGAAAKGSHHRKGINLKPRTTDSHIIRGTLQPGDNKTCREFTATVHRPLDPDTVYQRWHNYTSRPKSNKEKNRDSMTTQDSSEGTVDNYGTFNLGTFWQQEENVKRLFEVVSPDIQDNLINADDLVAGIKLVLETVAQAHPEALAIARVVSAFSRRGVIAPADTFRPHRRFRVLWGRSRREGKETKEETLSFKGFWNTERVSDLLRRFAPHIQEEVIGRGEFLRHLLALLRENGCDPRDEADLVAAYKSLSGTRIYRGEGRKIDGHYQAYRISPKGFPVNRRKPGSAPVKRSDVRGFFGSILSDPTKVDWLKEKIAQKTPNREITVRDLKAILKIAANNFIGIDATCDNKALGRGCFSLVNMGLLKRLVTGANGSYVVLFELPSSKSHSTPSEKFLTNEGFPLGEILATLMEKVGSRSHIGRSALIQLLDQSLEQHGFRASDDSAGDFLEELRLGGYLHIEIGKEADNVHFHDKIKNASLPKRIVQSAKQLAQTDPLNGQFAYGETLMKIRARREQIEIDRQALLVEETELNEAEELLRTLLSKKSLLDKLAKL